MPKLRNRNTKRRYRPLGGTGGYGAANPRPGSLTYLGPIQTKEEKNESAVISVCVSYTFDWDSDGSGFTNFVVGSAPSGAPDWSAWQQVYDEFRTLGMSIQFIPANRYSKATVVCKPLLGVIDRNDNTALTSYGEAVQYGSVKNLSIEDPWTMTERLHGDTGEANFTKTLSPTPTSWFKFISMGLTASSNYGIAVVRYRVQFRGRAV